MAETARFKVQVGDEIITFEGPAGLTDEQITDLADKHLRQAKPGQVLPHSVYGGTVPVETEGHTDDETSAGGSFLRGLMRGGYMNWGDELAAAGNAAIPGLSAVDNLFGGSQAGPLDDDAGFADRYRRNMEQLGEQSKADEELHPTASGIGEIAGAVGTGIGGGKAAARLAPAAIERLGARPILSALGIGGATGAASGAGAGEGNRAQSAALGGLGGAALGGTIGGALEYGPAVANYAKIFFNRGVNSEAVRQITKALHRDGFDVSSPNGVLKLKNALQEFAGKPVSLADIGGATRARAGVGLRAPSEAQQRGIDIVHSRQAGQGQRLASDIRATVAPRTDVHALDEQLVKQRGEEAARLRERALFEDVPALPPEPKAIVSPTPEGPEAGLQRTLGMEEPPETFTRELVPAAGVAPATARQSRTVLDPELQQLARLPIAQRALGPAIKQATAERDLLAATGKDISHLPDIDHPGADLDMRTFDYLKRYLDDEVNRLYKRGDTSTFSAAEAGQVKALRDVIRERLRTQVPEYGEYLDAYKGSSEMIDSLAEGREYGKLDPEEIVSQQAGRSTAGRELYRVGAARSLLDKIRDTRDAANPASRILNSEEGRRQLEATGVDPANMARLSRAVRQERTLNLLPQEMTGSQTAQRLAAQTDADAGASVPLPFNPGSPFGWAGAAIRNVINHASTARNAAVNESALPRLLETDPAAVESIITELEQHGQLAKAKALRQALRSRRASAAGGTIIGGPVALPEEDYDGR